MALEQLSARAASSSITSTCCGTLAAISSICGLFMIAPFSVLFACLGNLSWKEIPIGVQASWTVSKQIVHPGDRIANLRGAFRPASDVHH
jgi:hypothetical protein